VIEGDGEASSDGGEGDSLEGDVQQLEVNDDQEKVPATVVPAPVDPIPEKTLIPTVPGIVETKEAIEPDAALPTTGSPEAGADAQRSTRWYRGTLKGLCCV